LLYIGAGLSVLEAVLEHQDQELRLARADLCRFVAACYYEPGPEFAEERLFDSMVAAATRIDPELAPCARRLGDAFFAETRENLLVDYTRLFLGPAAALAQPYGSFWLSGENALMQDSAMAGLALYEEGGFEIDENFRELPDHIAAELEFLYLLICQGAMEKLRKRFLGEHLGRWVRPFTEAMQAGAETAFYRELAQLTERIVAMEASRVT
jgi:putative dimethyl sulfoxide reductase chaperone